MFHFTPLLGAHCSSPASSSLLELDGGVKILIDVGWDDAFDAPQLAALEQHVASLSLVLLTHPTLAHIGAYAHACKHIPLFRRIPVYATTPVINLGRTLLTDLYASAPAAASCIPLSTISAAPSNPDGAPKLLFDPPTAEEIASYFALITPLKYSQPHQPLASADSPPLGNLTLTAYGAGHTLGGTIWHLQHATDSIVYAHSWHQGRENLLPGATLLAASQQELLEPLQRPTALVCSAAGVSAEPPLARKDRDARLVALIRETLAAGGKVLIPTDSSARVLELAFLLNRTWREALTGPHAETFRHARLYMATRSASASVRYLQSMLEWVEDSVRAEAEAAMTRGKGQGGAESPMEWKHVRLLERERAVARAVGGGKACVLLASDAGMEWGFARLAFRALAQDPRNLVILTERSSDEQRNGLGGQLWDAYANASGPVNGAGGAKIVNADAEGLTLTLNSTSTAALDPEEIALYETYAARQRQLHSSLQGDNTNADPTTADAALDAEPDEESDSSEEEDEDADLEHQGRALNVSAQLTSTNKRLNPNSGAAGVGIVTAAMGDVELGVNVLLRSSRGAGGQLEGAGAVVHDWDVRGKRAREKVFPFVGKRMRGDEFGEAVRAEDFLRAEEREGAADSDMPREMGRGDAGVGMKRKWGDAGAEKGGKGGGRRDGQGANKRSRLEGGRAARRGPDDIDAAIARATGATNGNGPAGLANTTTADPNAALSSDDEDNDDSDESDYDPAASLPAGPRKLVSHPGPPLSVRLRISYVNFAARPTLRALQMLIPLFRARKVILIGGSADETRLLGEECARLVLAGKTEILAPRVGEGVDASVDARAWSVRLGRALVRELRAGWRGVGGTEVVGVRGVLSRAAGAPDAEAEETAAGKRKKLKLLASSADAGDLAAAKPKPGADAVAALPVLDLPGTSPDALVPAPTTRTGQGHPSVHVGETRLADLRTQLRAATHDAVFSGEGTLLVDGSVVVRKLVGGRVEVEGVLGGGAGMVMGRQGGGVFEAVRGAVYAGLGVVGGV
ncbi:hypothetical protein LTR53_002248 [Teratosphaeriaceae sp. CCFEE 6253]|nr:hypothetical protein LTR53_002248 [Teratosphaeriaceae sp. CCFEE 6253]